LFNIRKTFNIAAVMMLVATQAFASVPEDEISIAGLTVGETADYAKKLYGEPSQVYKEGDFNTLHFHALYVTVNKDNIITRITAHSSSYQGTPAGISFGTSIEKIKDVYGEPDNFAAGINGISYLYCGENGEKYIEFTYDDNHMKEIKVCKR